MIDIEEFLLTGEMSLIPLSFTQKELLNLLGEPDKIGTPNKNIVIYGYKNVQFSFYDDLIILIAVYNENLDLLNEIFPFNFSIDEFLAYLDQYRIEWEINENYPIMEDQFEIILENGISVIGDHKNDSIYSFMRKF